jgi:hypothetical protein
MDAMEMSRRLRPLRSLLAVNRTAPLRDSVMSVDLHAKENP